MKIKVFQTHKKSSLTYNLIQDKFQIDSTNKTIAIADGTTQSFRSEYWADKLVKEFCKNPVFTEEGFYNLAKNAASHLQSSHPKFSDNLAIASLERRKFESGSTSTFLGVQFKNEHTIEVISVGDSNLFITDSKGIYKSYPFESVQDLNKNQSFLNTTRLLDGNSQSIHFDKTELSIESGQHLILCTDSISRLFLNDPKWMNELIGSKNFETFLQKIEGLWKENLLEEDDVTIVFISNSIENATNIIPPNDFSFPEPPPIPKFTPTKESDSNLTFSEMDIKTIMHNFSCIEKDFIEIQKKQKYHETLLLLIVGLLSIVFITLLVFFFKFSTVKTNEESKGKEPVELNSNISPKNADSLIKK